MSLKKQIIAQRSWAGGQINKAAWRRDDLAALKTASKVQENWRVEATETAVPRPGRGMFTKAYGPRTEYVRIAGREFLLSFGVEAGTGHGALQFIDALTGLVVSTNASANYAWGITTLRQISWCAAGNDIVICHPSPSDLGMRPQIARYDPAAGTFSYLQYSFRTVTDQAQAPFFRFSVPGATLTFGTYSGAGIAIICSQPFFTAAMIGDTISIAGQQAAITAVADSQHATVTASYVLPSSVACLVDNCTPFLVGQVAQFKIQGVKIEIATVQVGVGASSPGGTVTGTLLSSALYPGATTTAGEQLVCPLGYAAVTFGPNQSGTASTVQWQEPFISASRGWPRACGFDRRRLVFYDFPQKQNAIFWLSIDAPDIGWVDASAAALYPDAGTRANNAILEFIGDGADVPRVRHVVGWGDEFVFTDSGIFQVPISTTNPLKPGSVEFRQISSDGVSDIPPIDTTDALVYINAGEKRVSAVKAAAASVSARPFITDDVSEPHSDLFTGPLAMAVSTGDGPKPERYVYVLNHDGTTAVGKFTADRQFVGWAPWTSTAPPEWVTAAGPNVYYTVNHGPAGDWIETEDHWIEVADQTIYLDSAVVVNVLPEGVAAVRPVGAGPLWWLAGQSVVLMIGLRDLGDFAVNSNGDLVAKQPGDDFTSTSLVAGLKFTARHIPLVPMAGEGESVGQRQKRRRVAKLQLTYQQSSGFKIGKREVPAYKLNDDQSAQPPLRDGIAFICPLGRFFDPENAIVKDRPGPLRLVEISQNVTV